MLTLPCSHVIRHLLTTATAMLLISGCASLSESQCVAGDWETVGYRDGLAGKQSARLLEHQNACLKHGVVPDRTSYLAGWETGIQQYCQPTNGFSVGESGSAFVSICPDELRDAYYAAYQEGRQLYLAKAEIESMNRQIAQKEHLLDRTKKLAARQGELDAEIQALRVDVALKSERLTSLRQTLAYAY